MPTPTENEAPVVPAEGATPPPAQEPPKVDPMAAVMATLEQMNQRLAATEQNGAAVSALLNKAVTPAAQEPTYSDPEIAKVAQQAQGMGSQVAMLQDQMDWMNFQTAAQSMHLSPEEMTQSMSQYEQWVKQGQLVNGKTPSRLAAVQAVLASGAVKARLDQNKNAVDAEARRIAGNAHAFTENGGTRRAAGLPDPETLSLNDRLEKYYPAALDKEGF